MHSTIFPVSNGISSFCSSSACVNRERERGIERDREKEEEKETERE
jgi:hypothetical protein